MSRKRKETEVFSLSFLDCICCGFGAVLLLFVLTASRKADQMDDLQSKIMAVIGDMEYEISLKDKEIERKKATLAVETRLAKDSGARLDETKKRRTELEDMLKLLLQQLAAIEGELGKLIDEKENMPTQEEKVPIPIPNPDRRQYLTGFDILGNQVLFLVEASGGMTADTLVDAAEWADKPEKERREAPKWKRVKKALKWMIANLKEGSNYKIIFFNKELVPLEVGFGRDWFDPMDPDLTVEVLNAIDDITPEGGANLEKAFAIVNELPIEPDRLVLICDGLPTLSDSYAGGGNQVMYDDRVAMLRAAQNALKLNLPVNTIMYPLMPDPGSAVHYWRLANSSDGSMISPSEGWPDI
ncbi:hypothetical protein [Pelagicoccus albus]|uniref:von Willebrand factor type A domain-containing protein n=1 Tax=Pelagicoccus albus TaxID=415222 RepID=A0A7X1B5E4_9BACT|nr:hypothetical protein [Pelagicoccus albus]MBC2605709.1 hypothetical protein [Pelagicoccus albus]